MFNGIFEAIKSAPTSDKYISCDTEVHAITNLVISLDISFASIAGSSISANPDIKVVDASIASGTPRTASNGYSGNPNILNKGVYSAIISATVPTAKTVGITANHKSITFFAPSAKTFLKILCVCAFLVACSNPCENIFLPLGIISTIVDFVPSINKSCFLAKGPNLGTIIAATKLAIVTVK